MQQAEVVQADMAGAVDQHMIEKIGAVLGEEGSLVERVMLLREEYLLLDPRMHVSPFPFTYYQTLFTTLVELINSASYTP